MAYFRPFHNTSSVRIAVGAYLCHFQSAGRLEGSTPALRSSLRFSALSEPRRLYSQGMDTALSASRKQVYTIPTYDAAFKRVLSSDSVRSSFLHAFIPNVVIQSSERLDDHMNPVPKLQLLRQFLHDKGTSDVAKRLSKNGSHAVVVSGAKKLSLKEDRRATAFLNEIVGRFDEIQSSFPPLRFDGSMDFVCRLDSGDYALVEMQVIPENNWDRRALGYVAAFYGNQLNTGGQWKHIRKVIGVNILGGGRGDKVPWRDAPDQCMRHCKFEDQLNGKGRFIDGIELIQYSVMNAPMVDDQEKNDWMTFFQRAHHMTEEDVAARIKTPAVLEAFELAQISKLPAEVRASYEAEDEKYDRYSMHTAEIRQAAEIKGKMEVALKMIKRGHPLHEIAEDTGLSSEDIKSIMCAGAQK